MVSSTLPATVELCDVGPRDGFQFLSTRIPTDRKVAIIRELIDAGLPRIQIASFVHPRLVPQMADAEAVVEAVGEHPGAIVSALVLNMKGLERARASGIGHVEISIATNERHSADNANMTVEQGIAAADEMIARAADWDMTVQLGLQTVFGYAVPGDTPLEFVARLAEHFGAMPIDSLSLADTTGLANPDLVRRVVGNVRSAVPGVPLVLHLHDTRGLGLANVLMALMHGIRRFDSSLGGLGGCPFVAGASGNIATEDVAYLLESMDIDTGVNVAKVASASMKLGRDFEIELDSKVVALLGRGAGLTMPRGRRERFAD